MKIKSPLLFKLGGLFGTSAIRHWMGTLDYRIFYHDTVTDPAIRRSKRQRIYIFWHEYIPFPFYLRGHCGYTMLLSRHQDAEILSYGARYMGFEFVRGSTNRGGVAALRELFRCSSESHLVITPDGPRGPRRQLAIGPIYLASKLQMPIVAMGYGYDRPWRFKKAWDQFAVPRPYSRARVITSGELWVPPDLDRDAIEQQRLRIEGIQNRLTEQAEDWAESGRVIEGERPIWRKSRLL
jgi:lysophospholipid acyltransferase (LPLAT)-like uncharacterized protein